MPMSINQARTHAILCQPGEGHTISAMGVELTFKVTGAQSDGGWMVAEYTAPPGLSGPPPHVHKKTTEIFYILEGSLQVQAGASVAELAAGGLLFIPPGIPHTFANPATSVARFLLLVSPAGLEDYFQEMGELIKREPSWPPRDMAKMFDLMAKYDTFPATDLMGD